jgi:hypothetical protein
MVEDRTWESLDERFAIVFLQDKFKLKLTVKDEELEIKGEKESLATLAEAWLI